MVKELDRRQEAPTTRMAMHEIVNNSIRAFPALQGISVGDAKLLVRIPVLFEPQATQGPDVVVG